VWIFSKKRNGEDVIILSLIIDFILGIVQSIRVAMTKYYVGKVQDYNNRDFKLGKFKCQKNCIQ
jgi:hypothetical protein